MAEIIDLSPKLIQKEKRMNRYHNHIIQSNSQIIENNELDISSTLPKNIQFNGKSKPNEEASDTSDIWSLYNKSIEFQNYFTNWKRNSLNITFDLDKMAQEKTDKVQNAMKANIVGKEENITKLKEEIEKEKREKESLLKTRNTGVVKLNKLEEEIEIEKKEKRELVVRLERNLNSVNEKRKYKETELEREIKKKEGELERKSEEEEDIRDKVRNKESEVEKTKELIKEMENEQIIYFSTALNKFEETREEIKEEQIILSNKIKGAKELKSKTEEEYGMVMEDLNSHLISRAESVGQREELDELLEHMRATISSDYDIYILAMQQCKLGDKQQHIHQYLLQKKQMFFINVLTQMEQLLKKNYHTKGSLRDVIELKANIAKGLYLEGEQDFPKLLLAVGGKSGMKIDLNALDRQFQVYSNTRDQMNQKRMAKMMEIEESVIQTENSIKNNINFVDSVIITQIEPIKQVLEEYNLKLNKLTKQSDLLQKAYKELTIQINEVNAQKSTKINEIQEFYNSNSRIVELSQEIDELKDTESFKSEEIEEFNRCIEGLRCEYESHKRRVNTEEREIRRDLEHTKYDLDDQTNNRNVEIKCLKGRLAEVERSLEEKNENLSKLEFEIQEVMESISFAKNVMSFSQKEPKMGSKRIHPTDDPKTLYQNPIKIEELLQEIRLSNTSQNGGDQSTLADIFPTRELTEEDNEKLNVFLFDSFSTVGNETKCNIREGNNNNNKGVKRGVIKLKEIGMMSSPAGMLPMGKGGDGEDAEPMETPHLPGERTLVGQVDAYELDLDNRYSSGKATAKKASPLTLLQPPNTSNPIHTPLQPSRGAAMHYHNSHSSKGKGSSAERRIFSNPLSSNISTVCSPKVCMNETSRNIFREWREGEVSNQVNREQDREEKREEDVNRGGIGYLGERSPPSPNNGWESKYGSSSFLSNEDSLMGILPRREGLGGGRHREQNDLGNLSMDQDLDISGKAAKPSNIMGVDGCQHQYRGIGEGQSRQNLCHTGGSPYSTSAHPTHPISNAPHTKSQGQLNHKSISHYNNYNLPQSQLVIPATHKPQNKRRNLSMQGYSKFISKREGREPNESSTSFIASNYSHPVREANANSGRCVSSGRVRSGARQVQMPAQQIHNSRERITIPRRPPQPFYIKHIPKNPNYLNKVPEREKHLLNLLEPLISGSRFYKRLSSSNSSSDSSFNPLNRKGRPEEWGYGIREIRLSMDTRQLEVRQGRHISSSAQQSYVIPVDNILKPIIPHLTLEIIKTQKNEEAKNTPHKGSGSNTNIGLCGKSVITPGKEGGMSILGDTQIYKRQCLDCNYYPFSFALNQTGRLELIALDYITLKQWVIGINALIKNRKLIHSLLAKHTMG